jgi:hypothetical protein
LKHLLNQENKKELLKQKQFKVSTMMVNIWLSNSSGANAHTHRININAPLVETLQAGGTVIVPTELNEGIFN